MSLDRSLKIKSALVRHRNVLTRAERLAVLEDDGRWSEEKDTLFGLPKVIHRSTSAGKKAKKKEEVAAAEGAPATGAAGAAAPVAAAAPAGGKAKA